MSLRKRKKQINKSVLPVLINPGPAPVAVNPFVKETGPEVIQGRRGGKTYGMDIARGKDKTVLIHYPKNNGCSNIAPPMVPVCMPDLKNLIDRVMVISDRNGKLHTVDITGMTPGQIEDVIKMYSGMFDEVSELTPENMEYIKNRLTDKERKHLLMGDWPPENKFGL